MTDCEADFKCPYCKGTTTEKPKTLHSACESARLEDLLGKVWDIARDNNLEYRARIDKIMTTIREKP